MTRFPVGALLLLAAAGCRSSDTKSASSASTIAIAAELTTTTSISPGLSTSVPTISAAPTTPLAGVDPNPIRVTITDGCPPSVAGHPDYGSSSAEWIDNPDVANLADTFVPGQPTRGLICRYAALDATTPLSDGTRLGGGDLYSPVSLSASDAVQLAASINAIVPSRFGSDCMPVADKARYTVIVFELPGRTDVDIWLKDWYRCPEVGNGQRTSGLLINGQGSDFLSDLDAFAPAAPQQDFVQH